MLEPLSGRRTRRSYFRDMGAVIPFPTNYEPLMSKRQLAEHLGFSTRWVELRVHDGLPVAATIGNQKRFRRSEVMAWLNARSAA